MIEARGRDVTAKLKTDFQDVPRSIVEYCPTVILATIGGAS
jgi:hypothetical protein